MVLFSSITIKNQIKSLNSHTYTTFKMIDTPNSAISFGKRNVIFMVSVI